MARHNKKSAGLTVKPGKQQAAINSPRVGSPYALTSNDLTENVVFHHPKMNQKVHVEPETTITTDQTTKREITNVIKTLTLLAAIAEDQNESQEDENNKPAEEEPWWKILVDKRNGRTSKPKLAPRTVACDSNTDGEEVLARGTIVVISPRSECHGEASIRFIEATDSSTTLTEPTITEAEDVTTEVNESTPTSVTKVSLHSTSHSLKLTIAL